MKHIRRIAAPIIFLSLFAIGACADLEVVNLNEPDRERVLASMDDVTSLISASYNTWFHGVYSYAGPGLFLSQAPFQHSSPWACATEVYSRIPRVAFRNSRNDNYYSKITRPWFYSYRAIAALSDGLRAVENSDLARRATAEELAMARVFARFNQGLAHATVAAFYDQGFRMDETTDVTEVQTPLDYNALMEASLAFFDEAIALASSTDLTLPFEWMAAEVNSQDLIRVAHSLKARFRAQVARTPAERQAVDWTAVIADVDAGIQADFRMEMDWNAGWYNAILDYSTWPGWSQLAYFIYGMADQSGSYQEWLALPFGEKDVWFPDGRPVLIVTPDQRFPQGSTVEAQRENTGRYFRITAASEEGNTWKKPERGRWRWSWYKAGPRGMEYGMDAVFDQPFITLAEMRLLKAEGLHRMGKLAGAAAIVNETRVAAGLSPTDAAGSNESCVPRLPDSACGDLWEMLKWEKRMETVWTGVANANWWFDGRGWGDFWEETPLQIPVPCTELEILGMTPCYTFGGPAGEMGSPGSSYAFEATGSIGVGGSLASPAVSAAASQGGICDGPPIR